MSRDRSQPSRWWHPRALAAVLAFVGATLTLWFQTNLLQPTVCRANYGGVERLQRAADWLPRCDGPFERYFAQEATAFLVGYIGKAGGASPEQVPNYFVKDPGAMLSDESTIWNDVLWAGVLDDAKPLNTFNTFRITFRTFHGDGVTDDYDMSDGFVKDWAMTVRLTQDPDADYEPRIKAVDDRRDTDFYENQHYPTVVAKQDTKAYTFPTFNSDPTGAIKWRQGTPGPAFCYTSVPAGSGQFWYRTRLGWVSGDQFDLQESWLDDDLLAICPQVSTEIANRLNAEATATTSGMD